MTTRQRPEDWSQRKRSVECAWLLPFEIFEWLNEWCAYVLSRWAFVEVLEYASRFALVVAVVGFFLGRTERLKQKHYLAWQVINSAQAKGGSGGRFDALEDLASDGVSLAGLNLDGGATQRDGSKADLVGSADSWILYALGVTQTLEQSGRDPEDFDASGPSPSFGEAQISSSIYLKTTPPPWTQGSLKAAD